MVKLNLSSKEANMELEGQAVVAIVVDPKGHDEDTATLMLGEGSKYQIMSTVGHGVAAIVRELGKTNFSRAALAAVVVEQLKEVIEDEDAPKEEKIFEGKMEEFLDEG